MDDSAFEALYRAQYEDLLRYALRRVDEPADAADVVAETWVVAWRRRDALPTGDEQRLWLFGVARRMLANQRRGQLRQSRLADRVRDELVQAMPVAGLGDSPVLGALRRLSSEDRDLLAMRAWEQLNASEIAVVLGCSPAAVRVRLYRARRRLLSAMGSERVITTPHQLAPRGLAKESR